LQKSTGARYGKRDIEKRFTKHRKLPVIDQRDPVGYLALRYSHPAWMVREFEARLGGKETEALLSANNGEVPTVAQVNILRTDREQLLARLERKGRRVSLIHGWKPVLP
jgi:16S rRNA (cytosine967-C5)-methyltransferase